jgi:translation initiation factor IF-2
MQQRRLRLGDILDDYCPRERRITNHAVVAMIEDEVKQTRCTTCDADHEYKQARVPSSRRRKPGDAPVSELSDGLLPAPLRAAAIAEPDDSSGPLDPPSAAAPDALAPEAPDADANADPEDAGQVEDDGPVHRPLIRATLPRPEGQAPERKAPDFTMRQSGGRFDQQRNGPRNRGRQAARQSQGPSNAQPTRFGGPRHGSGAGHGAPQGQRHGNRPGNAPGQRGGRPPGPNRGPRPAGGQGRKRGR